MKIMSAGPTSIAERVQQALVRDFTNTDLDRNYPEIQHEAERKVSRLLNTKAATFLMLAEPMAGLDGACASFVEPGSRALCLVNGPFSQFLADFVKLYGGDPVCWNLNQRTGVDLEELKSYLESDHDFQLATLVHCETPTGVSQDIHAIGALLRSYGIMTIVDSVSGLGGEAIDFDRSQIDCLISGSQKCLSAPVGLTTITLSERATQFLINRQSPVRTYYTNFRTYLLEEEFEFPYTQSGNLVYALSEALDMTLSHDYAAHHASYAQRTRRAIEMAGLEIFAQKNRSNTVTAILLPDGVDGDRILDRMQDHGYILSGGLNQWHGHIVRIAHMGNNIAVESEFIKMLAQLSVILREEGVSLSIDLDEAFRQSGQEL